MKNFLVSLELTAQRTIAVRAASKEAAEAAAFEQHTRDLLRVGDDLWDTCETYAFDIEEDE
jgi:hypothetical protein